jgi:hypothetical protein
VKFPKTGLRRNPLFFSEKLLYSFRMNRKLYLAGVTILPLLTLHAHRANAQSFALPDHFVSLYAKERKLDRIPVSLGALGKGAIESGRNTEGHTVCGATGNCPTSIIFRWDGRDYRQDLGSGWAYAVVSTQSLIPDIVIMENIGAGSGEVTRFSFRHGVYTVTGSDYVEGKQGKTDILSGAAWSVHH